MANKKAKQTIPKWAYILSAVAIMAILCIVYFCVPTVNNWVNGLFSSSTETEQPNEPPAELQKAETPTNVPYEVTNTTITLMKISNAEYSLDCIYWQDSNVFTNLEPITKYNVFVRIKETAEHLASDVYILEVTTDKATQSAPDVSEITYTATGNSVRLIAPEGIESSSNNGQNWITNNVHTRLEPMTDYAILVRYAETPTQYASPTSTIIVTTTKATEYDEPTFEIIGITSNSIVVSESLNTEYSINNGTTWQDSTRFDNLTPATEYTILARFKETATHFASDTTSITASTLATNNSGLFDNSGTQLYSWQQLLDRGYITVENGVLDTRELNQNFTQDMLNDIFCSNLVIDNSVSEIADYAFQRTELTGVTIPASVTKIGNYSFRQTYNLQTLSFSALSNLTSIGEEAFWNTRLTELTLPDSLTTIGENAFTNAWLTSVHIPRNVSTIGENAFSYCALTEITVAEENAYYKSVKGVLFNKNGIELILYPNADTRTAYTIPTGVQIIHGSAFHHADSLTTIVIPEGVTSIGDFAFSDTGITSLTLPSTVIEVGENLCSLCYDLTEINVAEGNSNYVSVNGVLYADNGTVLIQYPIGRTDTNLVIPEGVTSIKYQALCNLPSLTSISIPSSLTDLGARPYFRGCNSLTAITVATNNTVFKSVNGILFSADETICYYYPPAKVDSTWIIPATVTYLNNTGFEVTTNLESIIFESTTPPDIFSNYFLSQDKTLTFYVPDSALETYKTADWFNGYTSRIKPVSEFQG